MPGVGDPRPFSTRPWFDLARAGNFPSVASNVLAALVLSHPLHAWPATGLLLAALAAGFLAYAGGATFNDVFDYRFDTRNRPERAIPSGRVSRRGAAVIGTLELGLGLAILFFLRAHFAWVAALLASILLYDWLHKKWAGSVLLMASCRATLALALATVPGHAPAPVFVGWTAALFIYIVVLSLLARREYRTGNAKDGKSIGRLLAFIPLIDAGALAVAVMQGPGGVGTWAAVAACALAVPLGKWAQKRAAAT